MLGCVTLHHQKWCKLCPSLSRGGIVLSVFYCTLGGKNKIGDEVVDIKRREADEI